MSIEPHYLAAESGFLDMVQLLINRGADINQAPAYQGGGTALQLASMEGYVAVVCKLLEHGAEVYAPRPKGSEGRTAFEGAAEHGRLDVLQVLWNATFCLGFDSDQMEKAMELAEANGRRATKAFIASLAATLPNALDAQSEDQPANDPLATYT